MAINKLVLLVITLIVLAGCARIKDFLYAPAKPPESIPAEKPTAPPSPPAEKAAPPAPAKKPPAPPRPPTEKDLPPAPTKQPPVRAVPLPPVEEPSSPAPAEKATPPAKKVTPTPAKPPAPEAVPPAPVEEPSTPKTRLEQQATPEQERSLIATILTEINRAQTRLRRININALSLEAKDIYDTVSSFLERARSALDLKEYERALNLAKKARILAEDLVK